MKIVNDGAQRSHDVVAAFDVGSNSIKMTVARHSPATGLSEFLWRSETVRLGQGIEATGRIADDRMAAALDALGRFAREARAAGATRLVGVATEATRVASNGDAFLQMLTDEIGLEIQSISGDREAQLTFLGLDGVAPLEGNVLVADIGGGSTELILASDRQVEWSASYALGSGRLADRFFTGDPPSLDQLQDCAQVASDTMRDAPLERAIDGRLIVVGGTGEYIDRLLPPASSRTPEMLAHVIELLTREPSERIAERIGASQARARVLPAGIAIALAIAERARPLELAVAQSGIRRGLLLAAFAGEI